MKNPTKTLNRKALIRRFSQMHRKNMNNPLKCIPWDTNYDFYNLSSTEERQFFLKTREIIDELTQIMIFVQKIEEFGCNNSTILKQIQSIQMRLRCIDQDYKYAQIIHILTKYLGSIRRYSITIYINSVPFYKQLFEWTFLAITRELDYLEEDIY